MLIISDLHYRCDTPSWRKELNYSAVLRHKLGVLLDTGEAVVVAGDVFHRADDIEAIFDLFMFLKKRKAVLYATRGQHDQIYHNDTLASTGFNLLVGAGLIIPLGAEPRCIAGHSVVGMGWGEKAPTCGGAVLIAHVPVSHSGAVYKGATSATAFRANCVNYTHIFTGDNHKRFSVNGLYNAGCFHRMTDDLENQPPAAWRLKPDGTVELFEIPCPPPLIDLAYREAQDKGKAAVAGVEFVRALAEARQKGGADVFLSALRGAESTAEGGVKALLQGVIKLCEEAHT